MSSFTWFRLFLVRQRIRWGYIPLIIRHLPMRRSVALPTMTALPLWLAVRAAIRVENNNETGRPTNLASIVEQMDDMFDKGEYQKAYDYIQRNGNDPLFESYYIQWRIARIFYKVASETKEKNTKRKLVEEGFEYVKKALHGGNHISSVHKWYGILLNEKSQYASTEEQVRCAYEVLDHFEEACRLNPLDPTTHHCLGIWYWEISRISGWKRKLAKFTFGELPRGTAHDALKKFLLAEELSPGFYSKNLLMLVKCYTELNSPAPAMEFAKLLLKRERKTQEDEEVYEEVKKIIPRIERLLPYPAQASFSKHI